MSIDENNAYRITESLAFPRLVGSEGEKKAVKIIVDEFKKSGYDNVKQETFKTSFQNWIMARYIFFPIALFIMLLWWFFTIHVLLAFGFIILFFIVAAKGASLMDNTTIALSKNEENNYDTDNIFVELKSKNSKAKVVFLGHYDTKSQTFPSAVRIAVFMIAILGDLLVLFLYLILTIVNLLVFFGILPVIDFTLFNLIMFFVCIFLSLVGCLNYFNKTGNDSPGCYDNGASVGTVIELARYYKNNPLDNIDLIFITPSSEELNLGGAKDYIQKHKNEFDPKKSYFINFDGIGGEGFIRLITAYGIPRKTSSKTLNDLLVTSAKELNIPAKVIYLPTGAWSDFMPILKQGFEACWLASSGGAVKYVHTRKDTMDLVTKEGLRNTLKLVVHVAGLLNDSYN